MSENKLKINVYVDFDGVLNSSEHPGVMIGTDPEIKELVLAQRCTPFTFQDHEFISPYHVTILNAIGNYLETQGLVNYVLSSTWRTAYGLGCEKFLKRFGWTYGFSEMTDVLLPSPYYYDDFPGLYQYIVKHTDKASNRDIEVLAHICNSPCDVAIVLDDWIDPTFLINAGPYVKKRIIPILTSVDTGLNFHSLDMLRVALEPRQAK